MLCTALTLRNPEGHDVQTAPCLVEKEHVLYAVESRARDKKADKRQRLRE